MCAIAFAEGRLGLGDAGLSWKTPVSAGLGREAEAKETRRRAGADGLGREAEAEETRRRAGADGLGHQADGLGHQGADGLGHQLSRRQLGRETDAEETRRRSNVDPGPSSGPGPGSLTASETQ